MKTLLLSLINHRKVGGLHFIRIGSLSVSFCRTKKHRKPAVCKLRGCYSPLPSFTRATSAATLLIVSTLN